VDAVTLATIEEEQADEGIAITHTEWKKTGLLDQDERISFYLAVLRKYILRMERKLNCLLDHLPLIISGMGSSSIGIIHLPYQLLPFSTDGKDIKTYCIQGITGFKNDILLISGVQSREDVMRGEEIQLMGCIPDAVGIVEEQLYIFPGTHAKHILVKNGEVVSFKTYMTGEFFNVLSSKSILSESVEVSEQLNSLDIFKRGVRDSLNSNLLNVAFRVRTNNLFNKVSKKENYFYLSGLLIGTELQSLQSSTTKLCLCSESNLSIYYKAALEVFGLLERTTIVPSELVEQAAIKGQLKIFNRVKDERKI
jgi:2-dehydro-3-deoxygalactonokinase